jgi:hypothetical protein
MNGQRYPLLALVGLLALSPAAFAQTKPAAKPATPAPAPATTAPAAPVRLAPPMRGDVKVEMTKPVVKREGNFVNTTFKVKNVETGSIAGLRIDEFWYDKKGDPVTGDSFRYNKPLQPGEVIEVKLHTPVNPKMDRNQYLFKQANGNVKPTTVPKL